MSEDKERKEELAKETNKEDNDNKMIKCDECDGSGRVDCDECGGSGDADCNKCAGDGEVKEDE